MQWNQCDIFLDRGDITALEVDAIVNAANTELLPGGGVCGAIHRQGGSRIALECAAFVKMNGPVPVGGAAMTTGGNLPARHVIHAVGPVFGDHAPEEADRLLADAYRQSIAIARENHLSSIAFPCISTGIYGFPPERACPVALKAVHDELLARNQMERLIFCTFLEADLALYRAHLGKLVW